MRGGGGVVRSSCQGKKEKKGRRASLDSTPAGSGRKRGGRGGGKAEDR